MKKLRLQFVLLLTICVGNIPKAQVNNNVFTCMQETVPVWQSEYNVPAVGIGIIEEGEIKHIKVFGELASGVPAPDNTIFCVASITKPVVTMLTLKLVESGQWNLDEPLANYWIDPEVANDPFHKKLTTRHVLNHQTGFPNWAKGKLAFKFEPGTDYTYSGEGFQYLKKAIENKFHTSLAVLADSILFKPLGMNDSYLRWDNNIDESRFACRHDANGNIYKPPIPNGRGVNAAASLMTTVEDLCKLLSGLPKVRDYSIKRNIVLLISGILSVVVFFILGGFRSLISALIEVLTNSSQILMPSEMLLIVIITFSLIVVFIAGLEYNKNTI